MSEVEPGCPSRRLRLSLLVPLLALTLVVPGLGRTSSVEWQSLDNTAQPFFGEEGPFQVFPESVAPETLGRVCGPDLDGLRAYFLEQGVAFEENLAHQVGDRTCHVFYRPTLAGFKAHHEDRPVRGLLFDFDATRFVTRGDEELGDSLDVVRSILRSLDRKVPVSIGLGRGLSPVFYEEARLRHFGDIDSPVLLRDNGAVGFNPWVQDYIKSGQVAGSGRILVPRRLFEGVPANGTAFLAQLDELCRQDPRFVRSNLSWEGGDLLFVQDTNDPGRLILFHGEAAKPYWGRNLSAAEYAYVLKNEFGADEAVDLSGLAAHIDYELAFLPEAGIALLATPLTGNVNLAREALGSLMARMPQPHPKELVKLRDVLSRPGLRSGDSAAVLKVVRRAIEERDKWRLTDADQEASPLCCDTLTFQDLERLLTVDPETARARTRAEYARRFDHQTIGAYLAIVESQFLETPDDVHEKVRRGTEKLTAAGFEVVHVPRVGGHPNSQVPWSGISSVNLVVIDQKLFVPRFGFGSEEDDMLDQLAGRLPDRYQVVPIFAQHLLIHNGGLHCISGILR